MKCVADAIWSSFIGPIMMRRKIFEFDFRQRIQPMWRMREIMRRDNDFAKPFTSTNVAGCLHCQLALNFDKGQMCAGMNLYDLSAGSLLLGNVMEDSDARKFEQLSNELQVAAINLMKHLRTNHARIRIKDTLPELYITLGEGRHAHGVDANGSGQRQVAEVPAAQGTAPPSVFAKLRKALAA